MRFNFFDKNLISILVTSFMSLLIFFSRDTSYVNKVEKNIVDSIVFFSKPKLWYDNLLIVNEENLLLKQKITQLNLLNAKYDNYRIENEFLRKMLDFKESYSKISLIPSNIVKHNISSINSLVIDLSKNDGIDVNQAAIDMNGLIGKTINVGEYGSKIQLINDKNFAVSVKVGKDKVLGIFKPIHGNKGILEGIIKSSQLSVGDMVYTSGITEIYPPDIPVARVLSLSEDEDKPFKVVVVEIIADLKNLNYVFIIQ